MKPVLIETAPVIDERGFLVVAYNEMELNDRLGDPIRFVQENHSRSQKTVLRGLHYQLPPSAQAKLVRVVRGAIFDVVVDIRRSSPSFGQWEGYELSEDNFRQLLVPTGFAHGFLTLTETTDVLYKTSDYYAPERERTIAWDDPEIGIEWPLRGNDPIVSEKDQAAPSISQAEVFD